MIFPYRRRPNVGKHPLRLQWKCSKGASERSLVRRRSLNAFVRIILTIATLLCQAAVFTESKARADAQLAPRAQPVNRFAELVADAAARFTVPARWISAVMQIESGGDERAISSRGAIGLIQLMPTTWVELSVRHGLGLDPFEPRDNILAGGAYLRELHDRFGSAGFLAAYHAGPARYEQHLATGRPLPPETTAYVAAVALLLNHQQVEATQIRTKRSFLWQEAPLFVERAGAP
ncbi:MAG: lytic transglycosylase domain-containing protein [Bradyrhizobium sp.]|nr:lytic transglycosylase domain-containing protein [Bradyrhizobium sp.]